jgi:filamentous hemagglutinin
MISEGDLFGKDAVQDIVNVGQTMRHGNAEFTTDIGMQISKDAQLMNSGAVNGVNWHFFTSPVTGLGGPCKYC